MIINMSLKRHNDLRNKSIYYKYHVIVFAFLLKVIFVNNMPRSALSDHDINLSYDKQLINVNVFIHGLIPMYS